MTRRACVAGRGSYRGAFVHKYIQSRSASRRLLVVLSRIRFRTRTDRRHGYRDVEKRVAEVFIYEDI
jgi:hypothetical protein